MLLSLHLFLVESLQVGLFLLRLLFNSVLIMEQHAVSLIEAGLILRDLIIELSNESLIGLLLHIELDLLVPLLVVNLLLQMLNPVVGLVQLGLLNQDLLRELDLRLGLLVLLGQLVIVFHAEAGQNTIKTNREQLGVVIVHPHSLDLLAMSLHFHLLV